ncbi:MAG: PD40 domain-containing protein [Chloroflexi bacterium]|nr:PD40 domain-containing protein [Chloroflexota bacterium]
MREIRLFLVGILVASTLVMIGALAAAFVIQVDRFENSTPSSFEDTTPSPTQLPTPTSVPNTPTPVPLRPTPTVVWPTPTPTPEPSVQPTVPPTADQGLIVWRSDRDGNHEIYIRDLDGSKQVRLTNNLRNDSDPILSPQGDKIAFVSGDRHRRQIYILPLDGSGEVNISRSEKSENWPTWSPDGQRISFSRDSQIYTMSSDGSNEIQLTFPEESNTVYRSNWKSSWSPDGTKIAFTSNRDDGDHEIYVMNSDGSQQTRLTESSGVDDHARWSPDGTRILFNSWREGPLKMHIMDADGSNQFPLPVSLQHSVSGTWSPDGSKIIFSYYSQWYVVDGAESGDFRLVPGLDPNDLNWSPEWGVKGAGISLSSLPPPGDARFTIIPGIVTLAQDRELSLSLRDPLGEAGRLGENLRPHVKDGSNWVEIRNPTIVDNDDYRFTLYFLGCQTETADLEGAGYQKVVYCEVSIGHGGAGGTETVVPTATPVHVRRVVQ